MLKSTFSVFLILFVITAIFWLVFRYRSGGLFSGQSAQLYSVSAPATIDIRIGQVKIIAETADTIWKKIKGLSGRDGLSENAGMLFPYNKPGFYAFWMRGMKFPIDIIWIGVDKKVVDITKNIPPESFPKTFASKKPAQYVLELPAGFTDKNGIRIGDGAMF